MKKTLKKITVMMLAFALCIPMAVWAEDTTPADDGAWLSDATVERFFLVYDSILTFDGVEIADEFYARFQQDFEDGNYAPIKAFIAENVGSASSVPLRIARKEPYEVYKFDHKIVYSTNHNGRFSANLAYEVLLVVEVAADGTFVGAEPAEFLDLRCETGIGLLDPDISIENEKTVIRMRKVTYKFTISAEQEILTGVTDDLDGQYIYFEWPVTIVINIDDVI